MSVPLKPPGDPVHWGEVLEGHGDALSAQLSAELPAAIPAVTLAWCNVAARR